MRQKRRTCHFFLRKKALRQLATLAGGRSLGPYSPRHAGFPWVFRDLNILWYIWIQVPKLKAPKPSKARLLCKSPFFVKPRCYYVPQIGVPQLATDGSIHMPLVRLFDSFCFQKTPGTPPLCTDVQSATPGLPWSTLSRAEDDGPLWPYNAQLAGDFNPRKNICKLGLCFQMNRLPLQWAGHLEYQKKSKPPACRATDGQCRLPVGRGLRGFAQLQQQMDGMWRQTQKINQYVRGPMSLKLS